MNLTQNARAIGPNISTYFMASGGVEPYTYIILSGGIGGFIDSITGLYIAPNSYGYDVIQAIDSSPIPQIATAKISVLSHLELVCDIIEHELVIPGRVVLWDQKNFLPSDSVLCVSVGMLTCKSFSNKNIMGEQSTNTSAIISIDIFSKNMDAVNRKEEVIMSLNSDYSLKQQEANSFYIAQRPSGMVNVSYQEGASLLYKFNLSVNLQYSIKKTVATEYYDTFQTDFILTNE